MEGTFSDRLRARLEKLEKLTPAEIELVVEVTNLDKNSIIDEFGRSLRELLYATLGSGSVISRSKSLSIWDELKGLLGA